MAAKKTYTPTPATVEVELSEPTVELQETLEVIEEATDLVATEPVTANTHPLTYTVKDGDTWASISATHRPSGTTKHLYAEYISKLNGGKPTNGRTINL